MCDDRKGQALAIFGWGKKAEVESGKPAETKAGGLEFSPEKAKAWYNHAKVASESGNHEYAMTCWLSGLRFDPNNTDALKAFFKDASMNGKPPAKDIVKAVSGNTPVDRYLNAVLQWGCNTQATDLAIKAASTAADLGLTESGKLIAPIAMQVALRDKRQRKDTFVKLKDVFVKLEQFDYAARAADEGLKIDPTDSSLSADAKNLSAQSTMNKGGYEKTGEAGGFRQNIRNLDAQQRVEEEGRLVKSEDTMERLIVALKAEHEAKPSDRPTLNKYVKILLERGTPADEAVAIGVLERGFAETSEFTFRKVLGEIRMRQFKRRVVLLKKAAEADPQDATAKAAYETASVELVASETIEFEARVAAYPTDLGLKYQLGQRYFDAGNHEKSIEMLQVAKGDAKNRGNVLHLLGKSFLAMGWHDESIDSFRQAMESPGGSASGLDGELLTMDLRYGLLMALQARAGEMRDLPSAEEAYRLASQIAVQQINYRDIRVRRDQIKALVAQLKSGTSA